VAEEGRERGVQLRLRIAPPVPGQKEYRVRYLALDAAEGARLDVQQAQPLGPAREPGGFGTMLQGAQIGRRRTDGRLRGGDGGRRGSGEDAGAARAPKEKGGGARRRRPVTRGVRQTA